MLTNYAIAKFNAAAYSHSSKKIDIYGWQELTNSDTTATSKAGYYGIAFINDDTKTIVIASSGTGFGPINKGLARTKALSLDLYADSQIFMNKTPSQFSNGASLFVDSILKLLGSNATDYQFITTGHSLGAVLSNLINAKMAAQNLKVSSINIDSPGSKFVLQDYINTQKLNLDLRDLIVTTYNAPPNLINTSMPEIGTIYEFQLDMERSSIGSFLGGSFQKITDTIDTHSLSNILSFAFDKEAGDYKSYALVERNQDPTPEKTYSSTFTESFDTSYKILIQPINEDSIAN